MKKITNQEVYDALTDCIEERWKKHADDPCGFSYLANSCALCTLFGGCNYYDHDKKRYVPAKACAACPVYLMNGGKGCAEGSSYRKWDNQATRGRAVVMLKELKQAKAHFFGDWKP